VLRDAHVGGHELALKLILDYARLLDLLGKQEIQFEQENTSLPALSDDLLGVPGLEGVLQHNFTQFVYGYITVFQQRKMHGIIGFLGDIKHHLETLFDFAVAFFAAGQKILKL